MGKLGKRVERVVDKIIPYAVVLLLVIIVLQFTSKDLVHEYHTLIQVIDYSIILIFAIDLVFKYRRVKHFKPFIRKYWLDVIAIFPFYLVFRIFEEAVLFLRLSEQVTEIQPLVHSGVELERAASRILREGELVAKEGSVLLRESEMVAREGKEIANLSRTRFITKILSPFSRLPRLAKAVSYYEEAAVDEKHLDRHIKKKIKQVRI